MNPMRAIACQITSCQCHSHQPCTLCGPWKVSVGRHGEVVVNDDTPCRLISRAHALLAHEAPGIHPGRAFQILAVDHRARTITAETAGVQMMEVADLAAQQEFLDQPRLVAVPMSEYRGYRYRR